MNRFVSYAQRRGARLTAHWFVAVFILIGALGIQPSTEVQAAPMLVPVAGVSLAVPAQVFIGSNFSFTVTFDNTAANAPGNTGYGPFIDLYFPATGADGDDGITFTGATYLGQAVTATSLTFPGPGPTGCVNHPYAIAPVTGAALQVCGPSGDRLVVLQLPFGSFTPDQPAAVITVNASLSSFADLNTPLTIRARGGYQFGATPLQDWCCAPFDATILSQTNPDATTWSPSAPVTPIVMTVAKTYNGPEDETATGPNFPRRYTVTADIAAGQTITNLVLTDTLPNNMQFVSVISTTPGGATCTTPSTTTPGGTVSCTFASANGTTDASFVFEYFIPLNDSTGSPVIPPTTGDDAQSLNNASGAGDWDPTDPRDPLTPTSASGVGPEHTLNDRSIAIQKSVAIVNNVGPAGNSPGDTLEYTLTFQISDFFAFQNVNLTDVISDGQRFDSSFAPTVQINGNGYNIGVPTAVSMAGANVDVDCNYTGGPGGECDTDNPAANDGTTEITFNVSQEIIARDTPGPTDSQGRLIGGCIPFNAATEVGGTGGPTPDCATYNNAATTGTIRFRVIIQDQFSDDFPSGDQSVDHGDVLDNDVTIAGDLLSVANVTTLTGSAESDDSSTQVSIQFGALTKSIFAVNGSTSFSSPVSVRPGDTLTYRLRYTLPTSDFETLSLVDYLPLPVLYATEMTGLDDVGGFGNPTVIPAAGRANFGPADTFRALAGNAVGCPIPVGGTGDGTPCLTVDAASNLLTFSYGNFDDPLNRDTEIDLLFTVTVSDDPFADGLFLTNQAHAYEGTTNAGSQQLDGIVQIVLTEPVLVFGKSVIASDNPNAIYTPTLPTSVTFNAPGSPGARWTGNLNSTVLANEGLNSNVSAIEAGDTVSFALVIENQGTSANGAFDIDIRDTIPPGFSIPVGGLNLRVAYGDNSSTIAFTRPNGSPAVDTDLFDPPSGSGTGIRLVDPGGGAGACQVHSLTSGRNVIVITYDLQVDFTVEPNQTLVNTGTLFNYAGSEGGPDHTTSDLTDDASVTIRAPSLAKSLTGTEVNNANNSSTQAVIGEFVTYTLTLNVPQGVSPTASIVDTMDAGLAFVDVQSVTYSPTVTSTNVIGTGTNPANVTIGSSGGGTGNQLTFNFGSITNTDSDPTATETITVVYRAVVLNVAGNQSGTLLNNAATFAWGTNAPIAQTAPTADVTVIEPDINITKTISPTTGDAGDTVTYTITLTGATTTDAFDVTLDDTFPAQIVSPAISSVTDTASLVTAANFDLTGSALTTVTPFDMPVIAGRTITIQITGTIAFTVSPGQTIDNVATTRWTSLDGALTDRSVHNPASDERTGAGGVDDYFESNATTSARFTVNNVAPTKFFVASSEAHTSDVTVPPFVAIGEIVRYRLVVQVPEGTSTNFQIDDNLPSGLTYLDDGTARVAFVSNDTGITSASVGTLPVPAIPAGCTVTGNAANATTPASPLPCALADGNVGSTTSTALDPDAYGNSTDPQFKLGTLTNNDSDADAEFVVVEFNALVNNTVAGSNDAGDNRNNTAQAIVNGAASGAISAAVQIRIAEPSITDLNKVANPTTGDAGDTITYTVTFSNPAGANATTAFDVQLLDTLPADMTLSLASITVTSACATGVDTSNSAGNTIDVRLASVPAGCAVTVTYSAALNTSVTSGQVLNNTANLTYTSLPGANGTTSNPTGSSTPGASGTDTGERNGTGTNPPNDYFDSDGATVTVITVAPVKSIVATSEGHTPGSDLAIGEIVRYRLAVDLPEGTSTNFTIVDTLPTGFTFIDNGTGTAKVSFLADNDMTEPADLAGADNDTLPPTFDVPLARITLAGQTVTFDLGTLINNDTDAGAETVVVEFNALVNNTADNNNTDLKNNFFEVVINGVNRGTSNTVTAAIVEPSITFGKTIVSLPSPLDAGGVVQYRITYANAVITAFDVNITDALPVQLALNLPVTVTLAGGAAGVTDNSAGNNLDVTIASVPAGGSVTVDYTATIQSSVTDGEIISNTSTSTWTSLPGTGTSPNGTGSTPGASGGATGERTGSGGVNDYTATSSQNFTAALPVTIAKQLTATSASHTSGSDVAIGEEITYDILLTFPEGTTPSDTVVDDLPTGLEVVTGTPQVITTAAASGGVLAADFNGTIGAQNITAVAGDGGSVTFDLTNVVVNGDNNTGNNTILLRFQARVTNVAANQAGTVISNEATNQAGATSTTSNQIDVTVVEPSITFGKTIVSLPSPLDAGGVVQYRITYVNGTGATVSTAMDVQITDTLPAQLALNLPVTVTLAGGAAGVTDNSAGNNLDVTIASVPAGGSVTVDYTATIQSSVTDGEIINNTSNAAWTSLSGTVTGERTGAGGVNDYTATSSQNFTATLPVTITKQLAATSASHTTGSNVAIGEVVTYAILLTVPEGTTPTDTVVDDLPTGLAFVAGSAEVVTTAAASGGLLTADFGGAIGTTTITNVPGDGGSVTFDFTNIVATGDNNINNNTFLMRFQAQVTNVAANVNATVITNEATNTAGTTSTTSNPVDVTVVEPDLNVAKSVNDTTPALGQILTFTLTVSHTASSTADAFDVALTDVIPAGMTYVPGSLQFVSGAAVTLDDSGAPTLTATWATIPLGGNGVISYQAQVNSTPPPALGDTLTNTASIQWTSLPGGTAGERDGSGGVNDYADTASQSVTISGIDLTLDKDDGATTTTPGATNSYTLTINNTGNVAATGVVITDVVPANTTFNPGASTAGWACLPNNNAGSTCTFNVVGGVPAGGSVSVTFAITVDSPLSVTVSAITNSASVADDGNNGPEPTPANNTDTDVDTVLLASLGDRVWLDTDSDGIQDAGETGVPNVTVTLFTSGNVLVATDTTDAAGNYLFEGLAPGDYFVDFTLPAGFAFTLQDQGADDSVDSDADTTTGQTIVTTLTAGETDLTWDAGLVQLVASLGDFVWLDTDADGVQDAGETGVQNVTVNLYNGAGALLSTTTTDVNGNYLFDNLTPGDYFVEFILPAGFVFSPQDQGGNDATDSDADTTSGRTITTNLIGGENDLTWDAGIHQLASLGDFVWLDTNANGIQEAGENGVANVTVTLFNGSSVLVATTTTDAGGNYLFANLTPGDYFVDFNLPAGFAFSPQDQGGNDATDSDADVTTGQTIVTTLTSGENDLTWDAGLHQVASLGDFVWLDTDVDGIQDAGEAGVNNVTVNLYNGAGALLSTTTTNAAGNYLFTNLAPGDYFVEFILPAGFVFSPQDQGGNDAADSDADTTTGRTITTTLVSGENDLTWDAGISSPVIGLAKRVTTTVNNGDGTYDVTYELLVENLGSAPLTNVQVTDDLAATFAGATSFTFVTGSLSATGGLTVNPGFNGTSDTNLLAGTDSLAIGASGTITFTVRVTPGSNLGPYDNQAAAGANGPGSSTTTDLSNNGNDTDLDNDGNPNEAGDNVPTPVSFTETPGMTIDKSATVVNNGDGTFNVTYTITVTNTGNVQLINLQVTDDLTATFSGAATYDVPLVAAPAVTITSGTGTMSGNAAFNGNLEQRLLDPAAPQTLNAASVAQIVFTVRVNPNTNPPSTNYTNLASATATSPAGTPVSGSDTVVVNFTENPVLGATKAVASLTDNGDGTANVTYSLTLVNMGDVVLSNVQFTDDLTATFIAPLTFSVVSAPTVSGAATLTGNLLYDGVTDTNLLTAGGTLNVGATATVTFTVRLTPNGAPSGRVYNNQAAASGTSPAGATVTDLSNNGNDADMDNDNNPNETGVDSNGDGVVDGDNVPTPVQLIGVLYDPPLGFKVFNAQNLPELEWTIVWINTSSLTIDAQITDAIPTGTTFVAGSLTCDARGVSTTAVAVTPPLNTLMPNCSFDPSTNRIQWEGTLGPDFGNMTEAAANNELVIVFRVTVNPGVTLVNNQAFARADENGNTVFTDDAQTASNIATWSAVPTTGPAPTSGAPGPARIDPLITKRVTPALAQVGETVQYSITVTNPNTTALTGVVVTDSISGLLDFIGASASQGTFTFDSGTNTLTFNVGTLEPGQSATLSITARVNEHGRPPDRFCNKARAAGDGVGADSNEVCTELVPSGVIPVTGLGPGWRELPLTIGLWLLAAGLPVAVWTLWRKRRARS